MIISYSLKYYFKCGSSNKHFLGKSKIVPVLPRIDIVKLHQALTLVEPCLTVGICLENEHGQEAHESVRTVSRALDAKYRAGCI